MTKYTDLSASIEGASLALQTRKFLARPPERDSIIGSIVYPFKLTIFGIARIAVELNPKQPIWSRSSALTLGDELHGESIFGKSEKPLGKPTIGHATGTHRASLLMTRARSFAKIEIGVRSLLQRNIIPDKTAKR